MENEKTYQWEKIAVFAFGVVFISVLLVLVVVVPKLSSEAYTIFRIIIALAAAGIGAIIPGFLDVQMKGLLRAGGAMALFVVVYFFSPAAPTPIDERVNIQNPAESPEQTTNMWFSLIDQGLYSKAWSSSSKASQADYNETDFVNIFVKQRKPLGSVVLRVAYGVQALTVLPTGQNGNFRLYTYRTEFSSGQQFIEGVMLTSEEGEWKVLNHSISSLPK